MWKVFYIMANHEVFFHIFVLTEIKNNINLIYSTVRLLYPHRKLNSLRKFSFSLFPYLFSLQSFSILVGGGIGLESIWDIFFFKIIYNSDLGPKLWVCLEYTEKIKQTGLFCPQNVGLFLYLFIYYHYNKAPNRLNPIT